MKTKIFLLICTALFLFQSSSPWEGSASIAPSGELPVKGFFVATNSFPLNTVVDIINIANGKEVRVIVAKTLNSPGLLAIISQEAAELIGMRSGSISRIRMTAPSDPIAYQRFTDNLAQNIPSFSSGNVIRNEEELVAEVYKGDTFEQPSIPVSFEIINRDAEQQAPATAPVINEFSGPSYIMEPEWGGTNRLEIVDLQRFNEEPFVPETPPVEIVQEPATPSLPATPPVEIVEEPETPTLPETPPVEIAQEPAPPSLPATPPVEIVEEPVIPPPDFENNYLAEDFKDVSDFLEERELNINDKDFGTFVAELPMAESVKDVDQFNLERERTEVVKEVSEPENNAGEPPIVQELTETKTVPLVLEPTENKPPVSRNELIINYDDIIPGISLAIPENLFVQRAQPDNPSRTAQTEAEEPSFSVDTISYLEQGKFYVELASLPYEQVERAIRGYDPSFYKYTPKILRVNDNLYRILLGPLNQGESAAVLARFKNLGHQNASVRRGG